jgi:uncharacterized protein DUF4124
MPAGLIAALLAFAVAGPAFAQKLYRHVDEKGKVTYADRPQEAGQAAEKPKTANVESPEARRQLHYHLQDRQREEQAERAAQQRRYQSQRQRELEAERQQRLKEADPYNPVQDPYRPRARR